MKSQYLFTFVLCLIMHSTGAQIGTPCELHTTPVIIKKAQTPGRLAYDIPRFLKIKMVGQRCQASKLKSSELKLIIYRDGLPLKLLTTHSAHIRPRHFDPTEIQFGGGYPEALRPHRSLLTKTWKFPLRYKYRSPIARSIEIYPLEPGSYEIAVTSNSNDDDPPNVIGKSQMKVTCNE